MQKYLPFIIRKLLNHKLIPLPSHLSAQNIMFYGAYARSLASIELASIQLLSQLYSRITFPEISRANRQPARYTTLTITLKTHNDHRKAIQNARRAYGMERLSRTLLNLLMHNAHACYPQEKWPTLCMAIKGREHSISERHGF